MRRAAGLVCRMAAAWILAWPAVAQAAPAETAAECRTRIAAEYDKKIDEARNAGKDKAVEVFTRHKTRFLEDCNKLDVIASNQAEIAAGRARIAAYDRLSPVLDKIRKGGLPSAAEVDVLAAGYREIARLPASDVSVIYLTELKKMLIMLGRQVDTDVRPVQQPPVR